MAFRYIGIRGHRGAGKNTLSYLLGTAIEHYITHHSFDGFDEVFNAAVDRVKLDESFIDTAEFRHVYFESFADTPKIMLAELIGVPSDWMYNDWTKDAVFVNMRDFSSRLSKDKFERQSLSEHFAAENILYTAETLYTLCYSGVMVTFNEDAYITLRELISYFSRCMREMLGTQVWIKSLNANQWEKERFFAGKHTVYKIFIDCKFPSEITYIKNNGGTIIRAIRETNIKTDTDISSALADDDRYDYTVDLNDGVETVKDDIISLTLKLINQ